MSRSTNQKQIFFLRQWWKAVPIAANALIILWTFSLSFAIGIFKPFARCARGSTDCDWLILAVFWILPPAILWHIGLVLVATPRWKYFLYGLINSFLLFVVWLLCTLTLMDRIGMLS